MDWVDNLKLSKVQRQSKLYNTKTSQQQLDEILSKQPVITNGEIRKSSKWYNLEQVQASKTIAEQIQLETNMYNLEQIEADEWQKELERLDHRDAVIKSLGPIKDEQYAKEQKELYNSQQQEYQQEQKQEQQIQQDQSQHLDSDLKEEDLKVQIQKLQDDLSVIRRVQEDNNQTTEQYNKQEFMSTDDDMQNLMEKSQQLINSVNKLNTSVASNGEIAMWIEDNMLYLQSKGVLYHADINNDNISFTDRKIIVKAKDQNDNTKLIYVGKDNEQLVEKLQSLL